MKYIHILIMSVLFLTSLPSNAESNIQTGSGSLSTTAHLYFVIKIPKILYVRIGPDGNLTPGRTAAGSGDLSSNALTARVVGNNGAITFSSTASGALKEGVATNVKLAPNADTKIVNINASPVIYTASMP